MQPTAHSFINTRVVPPWRATKNELLLFIADEKTPRIPDVMLTTAYLSSSRIDFIKISSPGNIHKKSKNRLKRPGGANFDSSKFEK